MSVPSEVKLLLCFNESSKLALSIPLAQCTTFAITPLKWLRFLGFAIYGRQGSMSMNGPELDYTAQIEARSYYFISDGKLDSYTPRSSLTLLIFLGDPRFVDVDAMDDRTWSTSSSDVSTGRANFKHALIQRDGTCALTGVDASYCDACHLIPHSKGDSVRFHGSYINL